MTARLYAIKAGKARRALFHEIHALACIHARNIFTLLRPLCLA